MPSLLSEFRYALRTLARKPAGAAIAIATLAIGIGANTAVFSTADAVLWKPVPLPHSQRVFLVLDQFRRQGGWIPISPANYLDWNARNHVFENLAAFVYHTLNLTSAGSYGDEPERLEAARVTANFFDVLGRGPFLGRAFTPADQEPGREAVAVIGYRLWARRFASDTALVGKTIQFDGRDFTVVGVLPEHFQWTANEIEVYVPLAASPAEKSLRSSHHWFAVGRLKPGVSADQARGEMDGIARALGEQYPEADRNWGVTMIPLRDFLVDALSRKYAWMLLAVAGFVILMACANVANLQFARVTGRAREIAVRCAMGASHGRIARLLLVETLLLAAAGAAAGLLVAVWGLALTRAAMPVDLVQFFSRWGALSLDWRALAFLAAATVTSGLLSGLAPALWSARGDAGIALQESRHGATAGRSSRRSRNLLAAFEIAAAVVLLSGAGLMMKGLTGLIRKEAPMAPGSVLTMRLNLPPSRYPGPAGINDFYSRLLSRVRHLPGVQSAALSTAIPHSGVPQGIRPFSREGGAPAAPDEQRLLILQAVSADYFRTMGISLLSGRSFGPMDSASAPPVGIISRQMARQYWPGEDPIGKRLTLGGHNGGAPWIQIVGVAEDVVYYAYDRDPRPALYVPLDQMPAPSMHLVARTAGGAASLGTAIQAEVRNLDRAQPVYQVMTLEDLLRGQISGTRLLAVLMGLFSLVALVLASIGIYGVIAWSVTERTHEIGIRMALGATRGDVLALIVERGMLLALAGVAAGAAASYVLARLLANVVYGVSPTDAVVFTAVPALLTIVALAATWIPARRATKLDPVLALRWE